MNCLFYELCKNEGETGRLFLLDNPEESKEVTICPACKARMKKNILKPKEPQND